MTWGPLQHTQSLAKTSSIARAFLVRQASICLSQSPQAIRLMTSGPSMDLYLFTWSRTNLHKLNHLRPYASSDTLIYVHCSGIIVCGFTYTGSTAVCTATAGPSEYYGTSGVSEATWTESSVYAVYFSTMDEDLADDLDAFTTTYYNTDSTAAPTAAPSSINDFIPLSTTAAPSTTATKSSSSSSAPASTSTPSSSSAPSTPSSFFNSAASTPQPAQTTSSPPPSSATRSPGLTEHEKIGIGVGIVAFVLICCAAGAVVRFYRKTRRAANPNPSELYFTTDEKGQASGT